MIGLAIRSLAARRFTVFLTVLSVALSVALLIGVERIREAARTGFTDTVTGIDLIVAARDDDLQILLSTVFGIGATTNTVSRTTYEEILSWPEVSWAVPVALGDTHTGFPVVGTTPEYFDRYRYGSNRPLEFREGEVLSGVTDAVIGSEVADALGYGVGTSIVNAHGAGVIETEVHEDTPFAIRGVLTRTGTPVDRMLFVSLEGFAAIHEAGDEAIIDPLAMLAPDLVGEEPQETDEGTNRSDHSVKPAGHQDAEYHRAHSANGDDRDVHAEDDHHDVLGESAHAEHDGHGVNGDLNAIFVGLVAPEAALSVQRSIANYYAEPLTGVMPTATLFRLWSITSVAESALRAVSAAVVLAGLFGLVVMFTATLDARRREFAILRSVGASPVQVAGLVLIEALIVTLAGIALGLGLLAVVLAITGPTIANAFGLVLAFGSLTGRELAIVALILIAALLASLIPAWRVFRHTLVDGLSIRL